MVGSCSLVVAWAGTSWPCTASCSGYAPQQPWRGNERGHRPRCDTDHSSDCDCVGHGRWHRRLGTRGSGCRNACWRCCLGRIVASGRRLAASGSASETGRVRGHDGRGCGVGEESGRHMTMPWCYGQLRVTQTQSIVPPRRKKLNRRMRPSVVSSQLSVRSMRPRAC